MKLDILVRDCCFDYSDHCIYILVRRYKVPSAHRIYLRVQYTGWQFYSNPASRTTRTVFRIDPRTAIHC
jgi:hypothetical protein